MSPKKVVIDEQFPNTGQASTSNRSRQKKSHTHLMIETGSIMIYVIV
jgi:hypothetical protein